MATYQSPALDKGLDIIEYLSLQAIAQSQTEIASGIERKPNEIYRMLVCLKERGYIVKNEVSGNYKLSLKLYYLSHRHPLLNSLRRAALYPMQELSEFSRQSCHLAVLDKGMVLIAAHTSSPCPVSLSVEVGSSFSLLESTSGIVFLSQLDKKNRLIELNKTENYKTASKVGKKKITDLIDNVSEKGYNIQESELTKGVIDIAVPISIPEINFIGSLVVTILSGQIQDILSSNNILDKMGSTINEIYKNLGLR